MDAQTEAVVPMAERQFPVDLLTGDRPTFGWEAIERGVYVRPLDPEDFALVPNRKALLRSDNGYLLGIHSDRYSVTQPKQVETFAEAVTGIVGLEHVRFLELHGGRIIGVAVRLPEVVTVAGGSTPFLSVITSFDATFPFTAWTGSELWRCVNTISMSIRRSRSKMTIRHTGDTNVKVAQARAALEMSWNHGKAFAESIEWMANVPIPEPEEHIDALFPIPHGEGVTDRKIAAAIRRRTTVTDLLDEQGEFRNTGFGLFNAVNTWELWSLRSMAEPKGWTPAVTATRQFMGVARDGVGEKSRAALGRVAITNVKQTTV